MKSYMQHQRSLVGGMSGTFREMEKLLSDGIPPVEAAVRTGFSDQSYFTNYFNQFIGLASGTYREIFSEKDKDGRPHGKQEICAQKRRSTN